MAVIAYVSVVLFEGFWVAGAAFFSDGRDPAVNTAVLIWWGLFLSTLVLWPLPAIALVASLLNLLTRMFWAWPGTSGPATAAVLFLRHLPDLLLIAAAIVAMRTKARMIQSP